MYQVNLGSKILYYPGNGDYSIYDTELSEDIGQAGEFKFKVPPTNPLYGSLAAGELVTVLQDGIEYWRGEIKEINTDFAKVADVYCVEDLAWLADEFLIPAAITNETYAQRFQAALTAYNTNRSADRQFTVGYLTNVTSSDACNWVTEYEWSILDDIRTCIAKDTGYLRIRRVTSGGVVTRYLDCVRLQDYGVHATQSIEYGYNLLNYVKESDYGNLVNVLTPYGAELDSEVYDGYNARLQGTTITNASSVTAYGRHAKTVIFDGVSDATDLNALAAAYLTRYSQPQLTMQVEAVDLAQIENVNSINIGDSVRVVAKPFAVDQWLYLTNIVRDLQNAEKNKITLSGYVQSRRTLTEQAAGTAEAVKNLPSKSSILDAARKNALEILNGTEGGYVKFQTDSDDHITELTIQNAELDANVTKRWRWNLGGLAYQERPTASDDWDLYPPITAMTMDGGFIADFITAGTITLQNDGALLKAYNTSDTMICRINESGLYAISGEIGGFTIGSTSLTRGNAAISESVMGCGVAGLGIVNIVGNKSSGNARYGYIQISNSGNPNDCRDGIRIYGNGVVERYDSGGSVTASGNLSSIMS